MIIAYCIFIPILLFISGFAKAIMDLSEEGKIKFKPSMYWIKSMSSPNKWKDGDPRKGEKFFGSSRWFVSLTDAWHVFGFVFRVSYGTAFLAIGSLALYNPLLPLLAIPAYAFFAGVFHIFHTYKILRK
jgi:hypothetical protein